MASSRVAIESKIISVGLSKDKLQAQKEVILPENVVLPDDAPARMKTLRAEGRKWYLTVVYHPDTERPFALFVHTNSHEKTTQTSDAIERLLALARKKGILEKFVEEVESKVTHDSNTSKLTRVISLLLRHGVLIESIVAEMDKMEDVYVGSFLFQIKKFLGNYILEGTVSAGNMCSECDAQLIYSEGCFKCPACGSSKCG